MRQFILGLTIGLALSAGVLYAQSGSYFDNQGTMGQVYPLPGGGFQYFDNKGTMGQYYNNAPQPMMPYKSPC